MQLRGIRFLYALSLCLKHNSIGITILIIIILAMQTSRVVCTLSPSDNFTGEEPRE